jgi:hydroxypyruvate reductase
MDTSLRDDALAIWQAGVDAVRSDRLVQNVVRVDDQTLVVGPESLPLAEIDRIAVVGCGKAGAGMAAGLEAALGERLLRAKRVEGWINVPDDCLTPRKTIHLHGARPPGVNEPTEQGVRGAARILEIVGSLGPHDVCFCLISGGGSALLPAPAAGITLADKLQVTRHLSGAGANIQQLNTVRKQLSRIKGGRLATACTAGRLIALIISDVLGDPLDVIASGPTVPDNATPAEALEVLTAFGAQSAGVSDRVFRLLADAKEHSPRRSSCRLTNLIIGNNATAVGAAARAAEQRGYATQQEAVTELEGEAEAVGTRLADQALAMRRLSGRRCLVSGGEPTVRLAPDHQRGRGGRNQQLVLAAFEHLIHQRSDDARQMALLSGGTDGEDGPTDAAGAVLDEAVVAAAHAAGLSPQDYLKRNDAYAFFDPLGALIRTGPTHTNVCDLRIVVSHNRAG